MRLAWVFVALSGAGLGSAQIRMEVTRNGKAIGMVVVTEKFTAQGKTLELLMDLRSQQGQVAIRRQSSFSAQGMPTRKFMEIAAGPAKRQWIATFSSGKASMVVIEGGRRTVREIPLAAGASMADPSEFWFRPTVPRVGAVVRTFSLDLETQTWSPLTVTYAGRQQVTIRGKSIEVHRVVSRQGERTVESLHDLEGRPVRIDDGAIRLLRIGL